jgi:hypothetical protein
MYKWWLAAEDPGSDVNYGHRADSRGRLANDRPEIHHGDPSPLWPHQSPTKSEGARCPMCPTGPKDWEPPFEPLTMTTIYLFHTTSQPASQPALSRQTLPLSCPVLPCPALPCPALLCHALPCPVLPCHAMPCHAMPCHNMIGMIHLFSSQATSTTTTTTATTKTTKTPPPPPAVDQPTVTQGTQGQTT